MRAGWRLGVVAGLVPTLAAAGCSRQAAPASAPTGAPNSLETTSPSAGPTTIAPGGISATPIGTLTIRLERDGYKLLYSFKFRAPIGYLNDKKIVDGISISFVVLDPQRAPIIRWCFEQYATGEWTVADLVIAARARGLTTRPTRTKPAGDISPATMHNLLHNPYYMGLVAYQGMHYEGRHEPLIEPETWLHVQDLLAAHNHTGEKDRKWPHYLRGTIYCGGCGGRLVYSRNRGNGGLYEYYFCVKKKTKTNNCQRSAIRLSDVEDGILRLYARFQPAQDRIAIIRGEVTDELKSQTAAARSSAVAAQRRRSRLVDERAKLMQAHYAGAVPVDLLKTEMERLTRGLAEVDTLITAATANLDKIQATLNQALLVAATCDQQYASAPPSIRRQINQGFFKALYIGRGGEVERQELTEPFAQLLDPTLVTTTIEPA